MLLVFQCGERFLRLGRRERIHRDILPYAAETLSQRCRTVHELAAFYEKQVSTVGGVASSCQECTLQRFVIVCFRFR